MSTEPARRESGSTRTSRRTTEKSPGKSPEQTPGKNRKKSPRKTRDKTRDEAPRKDTAGASGDGPARRSSGQLRAFLRAVHPRQALAFAVVVAALVALTGRPLREVLVSGAAVLVAQAIMGLLNDLLDADVDRSSGAPRKPIAEGVIPRGNASFVILLLVLLVIPLSLQNGLDAGLFLLATLPVGFVHNRWLHGTVLSWVGWSATFALLTYFVTLGGWGNEADGSEPFTSFVVLCAVLGFFVHFLTSLPDLVVDNLARVRHLPLRIALHTGAPRLLVITVIGTVLVLAAIVWTTASHASIAR